MKEDTLYLPEKQRVKQYSSCTYSVFNEIYPQIFENSDLFSYPNLKKGNEVKFKFENIFHRDYILNRNKGIGNMHILIKLLNYSSVIFYKALAYMDKIFLTVNIPSSEIVNISTICFLLSVKFNNTCKEISMQNLIEIVKTIPNHKELEVQCLKILDYDLSFQSAYDYINNFFYSGIFLDTKVTKEEIEKSYKRCIKKMETFIEDMRSIDFSNYTIAVTIIRTLFTKSKRNSLKAFNYAYDIKIEDESEFIRCDFVIKCIKRDTKVLKMEPITTKI